MKPSSDESKDISKKDRRTTGGIIVGILFAIAAITNIIVLSTTQFETPEPSILLGFSLSMLIAIGIILLSWWKWKPPPSIISVPNITQSVGTACNPNGTERIAQEAKTPANDGGKLTETWVEKSAGVKGLPSTNFLSEAYGTITTTYFFTCQEQKCVGGAWQNVGKPYDCPETKEKTVHFNSGSGGASYQAWDKDTIQQSYDSGWYTVVP